MMARILYVEDNEDNIYMLTARLRRKGYEVIVATDGDQGVARARSDAPALILMDLSLPVLDGWEATKRARSPGVGDTAALSNASLIAEISRCAFCCGM